MSIETQTGSSWMRRAIALAEANAASGQGGPFGAVLVRQGRLIAEAANSVTRSLDPTAHAEVNAIRAGCQALGSFSLAGCELYSSCEPCPMCLAAALWARVDRIYFAATQQDAARAGFDDAAFYRELALEPEARQTPSVNLLRAEGQAPFEAWLANAARRTY